MTVAQAMAVAVGTGCAWRVRKGSAEPPAALAGVGGPWGWGGVRRQAGGRDSRRGRCGREGRVLLGHAHSRSLCLRGPNRPWGALLAARAQDQAGPVRLRGGTRLQGY